MVTDSLRFFVEAAENFCAFVVDTDEITPIEFLKRIQQHLLTLYQQALSLDQIELQSDTDFEIEISQIHFQEIIQLLSSKLADKRYYWSIPRPTFLESYEASCADLLDDLGDIYKDLKAPLLIYHLNTPVSQENAAWQFKFDFQAHWGNHCMDALRGIHFFLQEINDNSVRFG